MKLSKFNRLFAPILLMLVVAALLGWGIVVQGRGVPPEAAREPTGVIQAVMVLLGMVAMAAFSSLQRFVERGKEGAPVHLTFNESFISTSILEGLPKSEELPPEERHAQPMGSPPWDLSAGQLVGVDNALALARLRMDVERELRRIAGEAQIDLSIRPVGITGLARELVSKQVLPAALLGTLQEITGICNKAIHGTEVSDETAAAVVRVGAQLLEGLYFLPVHSKRYQG